MALRLQAAGSPNYKNGFRVTLHEHVLDAPLRWRQPRTIFVNSMSDIFHKDIPFDFIAKVFDVMRKASHHRFQVLTKRSSRLAALAGRLPWPDNVWMGVTVENADYISRIDDLRNTDATIKFISCEPLLGPIPQLELAGIDWVIVGGESGTNGPSIFATSALPRKCPSSSNNGAELTKNSPAESFKAKLGTKCLWGLAKNGGR